MKKIICLLMTAIIATSAFFANNFFSSRIFEVEVNAPVGVSNDALSLNDILVKDLVIDLKKINDNLPEKGMTLGVIANPNVSLDLNILGFSIGATVGVNANAKIGIGKDLFEFLGNGYNAGETMNVALVDPYADVFAYVEAPIGINTKKFSLSVIPTVFVPLVSLDDTTINAKLTNGATGELRANIKADANIYTNKILTSFIPANGGQPGSNPAEGGSAPAPSDPSPTPNIDFNQVMQYAGLDVGFDVGVPITKHLDIRADGRIPIMPGKMDAKVNVKAEMDIDTSLKEMSSGSFKPEAPNYLMTTSELETPIEVSRPLKFHAYVDYNPVNVLELTAGAGLGVRHPGSDSVSYYPEYYASVGVNLIDLLKASVSTEYTDEVFIHSLSAVLNLRFLEVDAGVSLQSPTFARSFDAAGLGANVSVIVGF